MEKRYQVFVSSTFADLEEERRGVFNSLLDIDCIVAGMEFFPAMDESQLEYIKRVIDDSDYYLLIIGGRYGSVTESGISYTEQEYDYAVQQGKYVIALIHNDPGKIPANKTDQDPKLTARLSAFREKVTGSRLVKYWETAAEVKEKAVVALVHAMKKSPAVGWVRANITASEEILSEINELRKENSRLKEELLSLREESRISIPNIAGLEEQIDLHLTYHVRSHGVPNRYTETIHTNWKMLFIRLAPRLIQYTTRKLAYDYLETAISKLRTRNTSTSLISRDVPINELDTVFIQFQSHGLLNAKELATKDGGVGLFYKLTPTGYSLMVNEIAVKTDNSTDD